MRERKGYAKPFKMDQSFSHETNGFSLYLSSPHRYWTANQTSMNTNKINEKRDTMIKKEREREKRTHLY